MHEGISDLKKNCKICKHRDLQACQPPCSSCDDTSEFIQRREPCSCETKDKTNEVVLSNGKIKDIFCIVCKGSL